MAMQVAAEIWKTLCQPTSPAIQITPLLEGSFGRVDPRLDSWPFAFFLAFKYVPIIVPKNEVDARLIHSDSLR